MARTSSVQHNLNKERLIEKYKAKRAALKKIIYTKDDSPEAVAARFKAVFKLHKLPKNSSKVRHRNRCALSGRPRGYYRDFGVSRIALRDLASFGLIPGVRKSSW